MNPPSDQQVGRLEGKVDALVEQTAKTEARNSAEHGAVMAALQRLETKLDQKVDWAWMREQNLPARMKSVEDTRSEGRGAAKAIQAAKGAAFFLLALLPFLISKGGL